MIKIYTLMETEKATTNKNKFAIFSVIPHFFVTMFKLMTFTIKSKYDRWFEIGCGILVWIELFVIIYSILKGLNVL